MKALTHRYIEHSRTLDQAIAMMLDCDMVALDTEFHRERSYFAKLALIQIAANDEVFLIDPLRVDVSPLGALFDSETEVVFHAAGQDLEILSRKVGRVPRYFFDTQIAAGFLGYSSPALSVLLEQFLGELMDKSDRLSDWLARPLEAKQLNYAAQDVIHLVRLRDTLVSEIDKLGRVSWLEEELGEYISQDFSSSSDPIRAWSKVREIRALKGRTKYVGMALAAWREERAMQEDVPPRFVLPDLALATIAQHLPKRTSDLRGIRAVENRHMSNGVDQEILRVIETALGEPLPDESEIAVPDPIEVPSGTATLLATWLVSHAKGLKIDSNLLGVRSDINELFSSSGVSRLERGWRKEAVGDYVGRIISGEIALALGSSGDITMVENSGVIVT